MLADVALECDKVGFKLHPDKTKILHNNRGCGSKVTSTNIKGMVVEVLNSEAATMYLGRSLSLTEPHDVELEHRIKKVWSKFGLYKNELMNKDVPLKLRLKLFHSVVTPTILYGCASWVTTAKRGQKLQSTHQTLGMIM